MTEIEKFLKFHKEIIKEHDTKGYNSIMEKCSFVEIEENSLFSPIHDLIDAGYINFISLDIETDSSTKYTIQLSDKAIKVVGILKKHE